MHYIARANHLRSNPVATGTCACDARVDVSDQLQIVQDIDQHAAVPVVPVRCMW